MKESRAQRRVARLELKERLYRQRYLVPNAVTLGNLFCGFLAIIYASSDRFEKAVVAIGIAILLDGLDGRVARRLNATSEFGVEFDSFSDLISFGVAPALVMYHWAFQSLADEFGVAITFVYAVCAASRLARFNVTEANLKKFDGLPTPGAAGMIAAIVHCIPRVEESFTLVAFGTALTLLLAYLMVCKIEFLSVKNLRFGTGVQPITFVSIAALISLLWLRPHIGFVVLTGLYVASGPVLEVRKNWAVRSAPPKTDQSAA